MAVAIEKLRDKREKLRNQIIDFFLAGGSVFTVGFFFVFLSSGLTSTWGAGAGSNLTQSQAQLISATLIMGGALLVISVMIFGKATIKLYYYKKRTGVEPFD